MKKILFYDTETTGFLYESRDLDDPKQPHLVQLAAILVNEETRQELQSVNLTIRPAGWGIPDHATAVHGITTQHAIDVGLSEPCALNVFMELARDAVLVAHNHAFDKKIIEIACKRYFPMSEAFGLSEWFSGHKQICTMEMARSIMQLPGKGRYNAYKQPNLREAYTFFTDSELENAHTALADTRACRDIYFAMKDRED